MNHCEICNGKLTLLQHNFQSAGITAPSDKTGEIRGCRKCNITFYFGSTRANPKEHWMRTPYKFNEFSMGKENSWDDALANLDQ